MVKKKWTLQVVFILMCKRFRLFWKTAISRSTGKQKDLRSIAIILTQGLKHTRVASLGITLLLCYCRWDVNVLSEIPLFLCKHSTEIRRVNTWVHTWVKLSLIVAVRFHLFFPLRLQGRSATNQFSERVVQGTGRRGNPVRKKFSIRESVQGDFFLSFFFCIPHICAARHPQGKKNTISETSKKKWMSLFFISIYFR